MNLKGCSVKATAKHSWIDGMNMHTTRETKSICFLSNIPRRGATLKKENAAEYWLLNALPIFLDMQNKEKQKPRITGIAPLPTSLTHRSSRPAWTFGIIVLAPSARAAERGR